MFPRVFLASRLCNQANRKGQPRLQIYDTYVDALNQAASEIIGFGLQRFMNTFAPVSPPLDNALLDFVIDLITLGTGAVAKPFFDWCK